MSDDKMPELLPCWCKSGAQALSIKSHMDHGDFTCKERGRYVYCSNCWVCGPTYTDDKEAVEGWNKSRTVSPAVPLDAALCRMNELRMEDGYSSHYQGGYEMFRTQAIAVIKSLMAQSPAASGAQTCQDADDALVSPDYEKGFEDGCAFTVATLEDNLGHLNYIFDGMDCCKRCKLVRPAEGWTRPCKGSHELSLRAATAPTTPLCIDCHHNNLVGNYCAEMIESTRCLKCEHQRQDKTRCTALACYCGGYCEFSRACGCRCVFGAPECEGIGRVACDHKSIHWKQNETDHGGCYHCCTCDAPFSIVPADIRTQPPAVPMDAELIRSAALEEAAKIADAKAKALRRACQAMKSPSSYELRMTELTITNVEDVARSIRLAAAITATNKD